MNKIYLDIIEIGGTIAFGLSGAFMAMEKRLDPFGVIIITFVTAIGGGTVRDVLIGKTPVSWLQDNTTAIVILCTAIAALLFGKLLKQLSRTMFFFDSLGLGLFTVVGIERAQNAGLSPLICIALGTTTGCFGGVLRDVLLNNIPLIFRKEIYASACIAGGLLYFGLNRTNILVEYTTTITIVFIVLIRVIAVRYKISLPASYHK
ncbi:trimeric intracellular cation channel family protein [Pseudoflavitalea sp. G-6-1-2]|uniref:trimeric intracellular cation channel family protein n=1 Tax=Pseudoflavitalea sp. G-6-1-2 TaxID=2728841 RepID=UPI00146C8E6F|nr:trimeric intracellular cation channel family protein [Pseudoflavitalea sp. G-6-1-2]NML20957.1 trimeric intracellular cation channel family protein [Pseudoflavitalea sp. G-6-1-2]